MPWRVVSCRGHIASRFADHGLSQKAGNVGGDGGFRDAEMMLERAQTLSFSNFRKAVALWVSHCDDTLGDPTVEKDHEEARRVQLSPTSGGMWILNGLLDALGEKPDRSPRGGNAETV